jgi:hypothetical protein
MGTRLKLQVDSRPKRDHRAAIVCVAAPRHALARSGYERGEGVDMAKKKKDKKGKKGKKK